MKNEQAELTATPIAAPEKRVGTMAILAAATERGADVATIEAIAKLYREERDDARRMEFDKAMSSAQSEMTRVERDANNSQTRSRYATYAAMDRKLRPIYTAHGFGLSFNTKPAEVAEYVRVTCHVSHGGGWSADYQIDMPADGKGAKGGDVMTKTHAVGSATQYGMRYLLKMIFNVATGEDDDGNAATPAPSATPESIKELRRMIAAVGKDEAKVCAYLKIEQLEDANAKQVAEIKATLANMKPAPKAETAEDLM